MMYRLLDPDITPEPSAKSCTRWSTLLSARHSVKLVINRQITIVIIKLWLGNRLSAKTHLKLYPLSTPLLPLLLTTNKSIILRLLLLLSNTLSSGMPVNRFSFMKRMNLKMKCCCATLLLQLALLFSSLSRRVRFLSSTGSIESRRRERDTRSFE